MLRPHEEARAEFEIICLVEDEESQGIDRHTDVVVVLCQKLGHIHRRDEVGDTYAVGCSPDDELPSGTQSSVVTTVVEVRLTQLSLDRKSVV